MQPEMDTSGDNNHKYLLYTLGGELYGSALTSIREVIKIGNINPVPFMVSHFKGVINLRGQIVSVIDLRQKFGLKATAEQGLILVLELPNGTGLLGAIVDDLLSVEMIESGHIDHNPALETKIPVEFFKGIAKLKDKLINLIDIAGCMAKEELRTQKSTKEAA